MILLKKYPVTHQCQEYEVRWEIDSIYRCCSNIPDKLISLYLYKVDERKGFSRIFGKKKYTEIYLSNKKVIDECIAGYIKKNNPELLLIEEVNVLFKNYISEQDKINKIESLKQMQIKELSEWDGII